jgi:hypothetical protein
VEALTKLLVAQNIQVPSTVPKPPDNDNPSGGSIASSVPSTVPQKKRKLVEDSPNYLPESTTTRFPLDTLISLRQQDGLLQRYIKEFLPALPLVPVAGDDSLLAMRAERPLLLQAISKCSVGYDTVSRLPIKCEHLVQGQHRENPYGEPAFRNSRLTIVDS